jgi:hypothetical protein
MAKRIFYFVVVLTLGIPEEIFGQKIPQPNSIEMPGEQAFQQSIENRGAPLVKDFQKNFLAFQKNIEKWTTNQVIYPFMADRVIVPLKADWYSSQLSFFCRNELILEKATAIPFRFRLGSLEYVDYLEQKPNSTLRR